MAYYTVGHLLHGEEGPKGPKTWRPSVGGFFKAAVRSAAGEFGWQKGQPGRDQGDLAALENIGDVRTIGFETHINSGNPSFMIGGWYGTSTQPLQVRKEVVF